MMLYVSICFYFSKLFQNARICIYTGRNPNELYCIWPQIAAFIASRSDIWSWDWCHKPSTSMRKIILYGIEEWRVRWKEKWHHPGMGSKPFCDCMRVEKCHITPYNYKCWLIYAHCIPFLTWRNSSIELIQEQKESPEVGPTVLIEFHYLFLYIF